MTQVTKERLKTAGTVVACVVILGLGALLAWGCSLHIHYHQSPSKQPAITIGVPDTENEDD